MNRSIPKLHCFSKERPTPLTLSDTRFVKADNQTCSH